MNALPTTITCKDGYTLNGLFYPKQKQRDTLPILIASATGILQRFYQPFTEWLAQEGYDVLTFDFRGIGESLHGKVEDSTATIQDWGTYDLPAAIDTLLLKTNQDKVYVIGHSAGGQLLGLAYNHDKVEKVIAVAGSSGYVKGLSGKSRFLGPLMFNVIFPISNLIKGYGATQFIGMGENLPKGVAKQWAQFCTAGGYVSSAIGKTIHTHYHDDIRTPITSIHATDDEIATLYNVKDFLRTFPNTKTDIITLEPKSYGHKAIGHMLMFRPKHHNLWPIIEQQLYSA